MTAREHVPVLIVGARRGLVAVPPASPAGGLSSLGLHIPENSREKALATGLLLGFAWPSTRPHIL
jgi:hypothetical protein